MTIKISSNEIEAINQADAYRKLIKTAQKLGNKETEEFAKLQYQLWTKQLYS